MELAGVRILIIGMKRTGISVARFCRGRGATVRVTDRLEKETLGPDVTQVADWGAELRLGEDSPSLLEGIDLVVPSPGVAKLSPLLRAAVERGIRIMSETELAYRALSFPLIAVSGTNGKSTTTVLLGEMFRRAGISVFVGGNLGTPLITAVDGNYRCAIVEVSSFQLEWVEQFRPRIGLLLNLSQDHLDRYSSPVEYAQTKRNLLARQTPQDFAVLNREDPWVWGLRSTLPGTAVSFGWQEVPHGTFLAHNAVIVRGQGQEQRFSLAKLRIAGRHNLENVMAAVTAAKLWGLEREPIQQALEEFRGLEHRTEFVAEKNGVRYINDSKGTNVGAVVKSLQGTNGKVILLAGGLDKGGDYRPLWEPVRQKAKMLILFGQAREKMAGALGGSTDIHSVATLEEAVREAAMAASPGDTVLLSPACASFDLYADYAERGRHFRALVESLGNGARHG